MKANEISVNVRFSEIDSMQIAHNSAYYIWFEEGRFAFSNEILKFSSKSLNTEILLPVIKSCCRYLRFIRFGDKLTVRTFIYAQKAAKIGFYYEVYNERNVLCAIGSTEHALIKSNGKMLLMIPEDVRGIFDTAKKQFPECFFNEKQKKDFEFKCYK